MTGDLQDNIPPEANDDEGRLRRSLRQSRGTGLFIAGIAVAVLGLATYNAWYPADNPLTDQDIGDLIVETMLTATPPPAYSAQVYQWILPSLAFIQTERDVDEADGRFGLGSGVVINDSGDILTALHVVADATNIEVFFADGTRASAVILTEEPEHDIAVLQTDQLPEILVPAVLGSSNGVNVGDEAYAVGNPMGLAASMSAGVISALDRTVPISDELELEGLIQFDTAVNPGNSGGPLLNRSGQVIGIVTALANPSEQDFFVGIGFAVPIGVAGGAAGAPDY